MLLYPYLVPLLDEYIFKPFKIQKEKIKCISDDLFDLGISKKEWEAVSYSIFFALKHDFKLNIKCCATEKLSDKAKDSDDCVFLTLAYLYDKRQKNDLNAYSKLAKQKSKSDFDQYWLFIYEVLKAKDLQGSLEIMKKEEISFVKKEYL